MPKAYADDRPPTNRGEVERPPASPPPPAEESAPEPLEVPDGTIPEVLAWVGYSTERAELALAEELARESPRSTLVAELERRV